jgi:hypothetical protein
MTLLRDICAPTLEHLRIGIMLGTLKMWFNRGVLHTSGTRLIASGVEIPE